MIVVWTQNAQRELRAVYDHIAANSPRYAQGVVDRITCKSDLLSQFPLIGAEVQEYRDPSIREMIEYSYRIIYRVSTVRIEVVSVVHGARILPKRPPTGS